LAQPAETIFHLHFHEFASKVQREKNGAFQQSLPVTFKVSERTFGAIKSKCKIFKTGEEQLYRKRKRNSLFCNAVILKIHYY
jgi:hypothetical protein